MARELGDLGTEVGQLGDGLSVEVADDAESLVKLRKVVGQAFSQEPEETENGVTEEEAEEVDVEADLFHAPGVMTYLAVRAGDSVISAGSILIVDRVANVWSVATAPEYRGQGAATAIMRAVCREASQRGAEVAALRTTDDLARSGGLYDSLGFKLLGHERIWELDDVDSLRHL
ncbi:GNAT family N-acetyltransferase [Brachybacterium tyrofermentans]|uniref:GNAT family N-acetyltransferase n=1 Tax=Brachybacterium tyrofermentans TaxID=47848 RepID=UPI003FD5A51D